MESNWVVGLDLYTISFDLDGCIRILLIDGQFSEVSYFPLVRFSVWRKNIPTKLLSLSTFSFIFRYLLYISIRYS